MNLPALSIRRPVMAVMLSLLLVIFGVISYFNIGIQETPNITFPVISISTALPGGSPRLVNETVTKPIEQVVNTIAGVQTLTSSSTQGQSSVQMQFKLGTDMNATFNEVQSKMNQVRGELPSSAQAPVISKASEGATPVLLVALYGDRTLAQLDDIARNILLPKFQNLQGVGQVNILGAGAQAVNVHLNLAKMAAMKITPSEVQSAFGSQHINEPGGYIISGKRQYVLNLNLEFHDLDQLKNLIVVYRGKAPIYLKDIATVSLGIENQQQVALYQGKATIGLSVIKKSSANTVALASAAKQRLNDEVKPMLPGGVHAKIIFNESTYIKDIVRSLEADAWLSILAAGLVIFLFLRSFRSTFIVVSAIPVSLLGVVATIYFFGYTFNIVTLLGIILLVGVVVDDSIVMLENIFRHGQLEHRSRMDAAMIGSKQVVFAVIASSLTLISIFIPVIFMGGIVGLFFRSFAVVVTVGVLISLFVSLTLTPMLCSQFLNFEKPSSGLYRVLERGFVWIDTIYKAVLHFALRFRWVIVLCALLAVLASVPVFMVIHKAFMPQQRDNRQLSITLQTPQGSSVQYTKNRATQVETMLQKYPEVESYFTSIGPANSANITVRLVPQKQQVIKQAKLMSLLTTQLRSVSGARIFVSGEGGGAAGATSVNFSLLGHNDADTAKAAKRLLKALLRHKELGSVYLHLAMHQPTYQTMIDRNLASSMGISPRDVANALSILGGGVSVAKFNKKDGNQRYEVVLQAKKGDFTQPQQISNIYLRNEKNALIRLDTIASLQATASPVNINRRNLLYSVSFSTSPTVSLSQSIPLIKRIAANTLPKGYRVEITGNASSFQNTVRDLGFAFLLIIVLMYMVLASQFNSFIQPLIVLVAQPLAMIGGLLTLWVTGQTLNIYSMIGVLLLMGLVAKNSILLVDLTNQHRAQGESIKEALLKACPTRMRPVIMTSLAIIFAMLPSALAIGAGSASHQALALVIIGGMVSSTLLTLVVVPSLYSLVEGGLLRLRRR